MNRRWPILIAIATLLVAVARLVAVAFPLPGKLAIPSFDVYSYFYPVMIRAAAAVRDGGKGLAWNPLQDCGQPFLASGTTGVFYPPFLLSLVLQPDHALLAVLFFNAAVGAIGAYLLCRELGLVRPAAVAGGLVFAGSHAAMDLLTSTPIVGGPYAWLPLAMLLCERILRQPRTSTGIGLGAVLALALLPGHPQIVFYTYQLIAARVVFEIVRRKGRVPVKTAGVFALGLVLPVLLGAVQLLPQVEMMQASIRSSGLSMEDIEAGGSLLSWSDIRARFGTRMELFNPFLIVPAMLAGAAFCTPRGIAPVVFYTIIVVCAMDLSLGSNGYLFPLYTQLPLSRLFRAPDRYLWIVAFGTSVLTAIGVDAIGSAAQTDRVRLRRTLCALLPIVALLLLHRWSPNVGSLRGEAVFIGVAIAAILLGSFAPRLRRVAMVGMLVALGMELYAFRSTPFRTLLPNGYATLTANAPAFELLQNIMTPQERIHIAAGLANFSLQQKTGSLFGIPALNDYESLPTLRYARYFTMLRLGVPLTNVQTFYFNLGGMLPRITRRRLLNLASVRYLVVDSTEDANVHSIQGAPMRLVYQLENTVLGNAAETGSEPITTAKAVLAPAHVRVYENPTALPRARWVPRVAMEPNADALLSRLSAGTDDLKQVALIEEEPGSGFTGETGLHGAAQVDFERNDPEHLVLKVDAPRRGFVVLSDQWFPGWEATVNGSSAEILRANYLFRLVEVPAGPSTVEFRYVPASLYLGAFVSAASAFGVLFILARIRRDGAPPL